MTISPSAYQAEVIPGPTATPDEGEPDLEYPFWTWFIDNPRPHSFK